MGERPESIEVLLAEIGKFRAENEKLKADSKRLAELKKALQSGCSFSAQPSQHTKGYMQAIGEILRMLEEPHE